MKVIYHSELLSKDVRTKRLIDLNLDIRGAAKKIGISPATLSRIENKRIPDALTLAKTCFWIKQPIDKYFSKRGRTGQVEK